MDERRPWYVDIVKEIGGLGLVLVMLVGLYLLADDFAASMKQTWQDIKTLTELELKEDQLERERYRQAVQDFMLLQEKQMNNFEERISRLEK